MGFYDAYDFSRFKMLSRINTGNWVTEPCPEFINTIVEMRKRSGKRNFSVAEIGIGVGATTFLASQQLSEEDTYYIFDFEDSVFALLDDLKTIPEIECEIVAIGNSHKTLDSYNWNLSNMLLEMRRRDQDGMFDVVYLDGAHTFLHDGLAVCMLKEMIKPNGILILDDLFWTYANSPIATEFEREQFPEDQWNARQVLRVQDIFLINDPKFKRLSDSESWRGVFKRID